MIALTCDHCGATFEAKRKTAKYCRKTCNVLAAKARKLALAVSANAKPSVSANSELVSANDPSARDVGGPPTDPDNDPEWQGVEPADPTVRAWWNGLDAEEQKDFGERAAVVEFSGGLRREVAERIAFDQERERRGS